MNRTPKVPLLIALAAAEVTSAVFAWRDLDGRDEAQLRGSKKLWRTLIAAQPGNSLAYWALGRR